LQPPARLNLNRDDHEAAQAPQHDPT